MKFCQTYDFQLALGDSADAVGSEVGVSCLDATQAAQVLVALLLPLGNQVLVCIALLYTVLIQLCQDTHRKTTLVWCLVDRVELQMGFICLVTCKYKKTTIGKMLFARERKKTNNKHLKVLGTWKMFNS